MTDYDEFETWLSTHLKQVCGECGEFIGITRDCAGCAAYNSESGITDGRDGYTPGWHGTEVNEFGITHFTDIVSAYPECTGANDGTCPAHPTINETGNGK